MANTFDIQLTGLNEFVNSLNNKAAAFKRELKAEVEASAKSWVELAVTAAPVDKGILKGGITYYPSGEPDQLEFEIVSNANYSAYQEWGTIDKVEVPAEYADYAAQFKGRGIRKNGGVRARHFFFRHKEQISTDLLRNVENLKEDFIK